MSLSVGNIYRGSNECTNGAELQRVLGKGLEAVSYIEKAVEAIQKTASAQEKSAIAQEKSAIARANSAIARDQSAIAKEKSAAAKQECAEAETRRDGHVDLANQLGELILTKSADIRKLEEDQVARKAQLKAEGDERAAKIAALRAKIAAEKAQKAVPVS
ncbi:MAG: hypothetical protein H0X29_00150 [Parachlamydiaceae bacterium]|nr:hypothetical protein [Parachlamydiaceae bacterium]